MKVDFYNLVWPPPDGQIVAFDLRTIRLIYDHLDSIDRTVLKLKDTIPNLRNASETVRGDAGGDGQRNNQRNTRVGTNASSSGSNGSEVGITNASGDSRVNSATPLAAGERNEAGGDGPRDDPLSQVDRYLDDILDDEFGIVQLLKKYCVVLQFNRQSLPSSPSQPSVVREGGRFSNTEEDHTLDDRAREIEVDSIQALSVAPSSATISEDRDSALPQDAKNDIDDFQAIDERVEEQDVQEHPNEAFMQPEGAASQDIAQARVQNALSNSLRVPFADACQNAQMEPRYVTEDRITLSPDGAVAEFPRQSVAFVLPDDAAANSDAEEAALITSMSTQMIHLSTAGSPEINCSPMEDSVFGAEGRNALTEQPLAPQLPNMYFPPAPSFPSSPLSPLMTMPQPFPPASVSASAFSSTEIGVDTFFGPRAWQKTPSRPSVGIPLSDVCPRTPIVTRTPIKITSPSGRVISLSNSSPCSSTSSAFDSPGSVQMIFSPVQVVISGLPPHLSAMELKLSFNECESHIFENARYIVNLFSSL